MQINARKSNKLQKNSRLCHYVVSVCKTSTFHIKIMISATDSYLSSYITGVERTNLWLLLVERILIKRKSVLKQAKLITVTAIRINSLIFSLLLPKLAVGTPPPSDLYCQRVGSHLNPIEIHDRTRWNIFSTWEFKIDCSFFLLWPPSLFPPLLSSIPSVHTSFIPSFLPSSLSSLSSSLNLSAHSCLLVFLCKCRLHVDYCSGSTIAKKNDRGKFELFLFISLTGMM